MPVTVFTRWCLSRSRRRDRTDDELKQLADDYLEPILAMLVKDG